jgi:hypothetical protein
LSRDFFIEERPPEAVLLRRPQFDEKCITTSLVEIDDEEETGRNCAFERYD